MYTLRGSIEFTTSKRNHLTTDIQPWEDGTTRKAVVNAPFVLNTQACLNQKLILIPFPVCLVHKGVTLGEGKAQLEFRNDIITDATTTEILFTDCLSVHVIIQDIVEILTSPLVDDKHRLTIALLFLFLIGKLTFLYLDIIFLRQPAQCLRIGDLFVLHKEIDSITSLTTSKTMTDLF